MAIAWSRHWSLEGSIEVLGLIVDSGIELRGKMGRGEERKIPREKLCICMHGRSIWQSEEITPGQRYTSQALSSHRAAATPNQASIYSMANLKTVLASASANTSKFKFRTGSKLKAQSSLHRTRLLEAFLFLQARAVGSPVASDI
jgi:hypothetical protein